MLKLSSGKYMEYKSMKTMRILALRQFSFLNNKKEFENSFRFEKYIYIIL